MLQSSLQPYATSGSNLMLWTRLIALYDHSPQPSHNSVTLAHNSHPLQHLCHCISFEVEGTFLTLWKTYLLITIIIWTHIVFSALFSETVTLGFITNTGDGGENSHNRYEYRVRGKRKEKDIPRTSRTVHMRIMQNLFCSKFTHINNRINK